MLDEHIHENVQLWAFGNKEIAQVVAPAAGVGVWFSLPASPAGPSRCMAGNVVSPIQGGRLPDRCLILAGKVMFVRLFPLTLIGPSPARNACRPVDGTCRQVVAQRLVLGRFSASHLRCTDLKRCRASIA